MKLDLYTYTSALNYLTDTYKQLKSTSESSLRDWSEGMGFESPSLLMDLLKKKRPLKLKYANHLAKGMNLDGKESTYFKTLIQLEKASEEEKPYFQEVLMHLRPQEAAFVKDGGIYSHWLNVVIYTLSQMDDFSMTVNEIKASLIQEIPLESVQKSLDILVANKLVERNSEGNYKRCHPDFITTPNDVSIKSSHAYYRQIISKAQLAVDMNVEDREFQCFSIGMKKENLVKAKEVMRNARKEIAAFWDNHGDHIYQFNFNGFPMAEIKKGSGEISN